MQRLQLEGEQLKSSATMATLTFCKFRASKYIPAAAAAAAAATADAAAGDPAAQARAAAMRLSAARRVQDIMEDLQQASASGASSSGISVGGGRAPVHLGRLALTELRSPGAVSGRGRGA